MNAPQIENPRNNAARRANAISAGIAYVEAVLSARAKSGEVSPELGEALDGLADWATKAADELPGWMTE